jgi:hypothetical protein
VTGLLNAPDHYLWHMLTNLKPYTPEGFLESHPVKEKKVLTSSQALNLLKQRGTPSKMMLFQLPD